MKSLAIGHLSRESAMNLETVRYYERRLACCPHHRVTNPAIASYQSAI